MNAWGKIDSFAPPGATGGGADASRDALTMAFQPIVDVETGRPFAYEALCRGCDGESASSMLARIPLHDRSAFDHGCRARAVREAIAAGLLATDARLSINFMPAAIPAMKAAMALTLRIAQSEAFPSDRLIFEFTENERMISPEQVNAIVRRYRRWGVAVAIDDFGAGHSGLALLARFVPDMVKLDIELVRTIDGDSRRRAIAAALVSLCAELRTSVIAEGVETVAEAVVLRELGVRYMQGYLFARPAFRSLPAITMPPGM